MANELTHKDPGAELTQAEYITSDGTGHVFESQATGDILYASSATVLSRLAKDANSTRVLTNTGTGNIPAWAQVTLTTGVTGTLPVANGGTGATALTNLITLGTHTTGNYAATVANATNGGTTIANSGSETAAITITINLNDLTAATVDVANDSIAIIDANDSNGSRKESVADFVSAIAGANLTATSGVLAASGGGVPNAFFFA
tara:strand:- start:382 stop:993 length:612 start_codon:yes stop_codon:yes gene_type:complete